MATRTVSQSGNLSSSSTFGGSAFSDGDSIVNDAGNGYTLTVDQTATVAGFSGTGGNGATTVSSGVTLTLTGNVVQGNANFTMSAGSTLTFDTTAADRKFRFGDAANFSTYANCTFVCNGTANGGDTTGRPTATTGGNHVTVNKTGSNYAWFDDYDENAGNSAGKTSYDLHYADFSGITNSGGGIGLPLCDFGNRHFRAEYCTFDGCGPVWQARPYSWGSSVNKDFYFRYCKVENQAGTYGVVFYGDEDGAGTTEIKNNYFGGQTNHRTAIRFTNNVWEKGYEFSSGLPADFRGNLYRQRNGDPECYVTTGAAECYWLGGLDHPGNPHCFVNFQDDKVIEYCVFECPPLAGTGECCYIGGGGADGTIIRYNLAIPCTDGTAIGCIANNASAGGGPLWDVLHNTVVGTANAQIALSEAIPTGGPQYSSVKSNLVVDPTGSTALVVADLADNHTDAVDGDDATHNGMYGQGSGDGYEGTYTNPPGANDVVADPQFVDSARNFGAWSVYKGYASSGDTLATKHANALAALKADPQLVQDDLIPWVRAGFAPTNSIYKDAGHDGVTIGAVEGVFGAAVPVFVNHYRQQGWM